MKENAPNPSRATAYLSPSAIQSLEKPVLNPEVPITAVYTLRQENPKHRLTIAVMPLALLALCCLVSLGGRTVQNVLHPDESRNRANSEAQAQTVANSVLRAVGGDPVMADRLQFSTQSAFSLRRNASVQEWTVAANSGENPHYLLRINSRTKIVYAINRVSNPPLALLQPADKQTISSVEAQKLARHYLRSLAGNSSRSVVWEKDSTLQADSTATNDGSVSYIFTCRQVVAGRSKGLIKIGVDQQNGDLSYYWNPSGVR